MVEFCPDEADDGEWLLTLCFPPRAGNSEFGQENISIPFRLILLSCTLVL
jgi:hypothetical protein